jgi:ATP-dependent Clp protease adaptor protein ClpS
MKGESAQGRGRTLPAGAMALAMTGDLAVLNATGTPLIEQETETADELDTPWQVVVHNDPINLMSYVTMVFQKVFGFTRERAEKHMLEVHREGRSVVWSGVRERGELYVQQLHGYLLLATLERLG